MTLETNKLAKDWLARNGGVGGCFAMSGVTYYAADDFALATPLSGGSVDVILMLQIASFIETTKVVKLANGKSYNDYLSETGETSITDADILWVAAHQEGAGRYCLEALPEEGYLKVNTVPEGASVTVDGHPCGTTPVTACVLTAGSYTVTIDLAGYTKETRSNVAIVKGMTTDLGVITLVAVVGKAWFDVGTFPSGFLIKVDGTTEVIASVGVPARQSIEVSTGVGHIVEISKADYITEIKTFEPLSEGEIKGYTVFPEYIGLGSATLKISAWDKDTGHELKGATFGIYGMSGEDKYKLPMDMDVKPGDYKIVVNYPGYDQATVTGTVSENEIKDVKVLLAQSKPWAVVEIVEELAQIAWIVSLKIPSPMAHNLLYSIQTTIIIQKAAKYQVDLVLYPKPAVWNGTLEDLLAKSTPRPEVMRSDVADLNPYPETKKTIKWLWTCLPSIPVGTYIVVSEIYEVY